ncbi:Mur ligase family protein [Rhodococcoides corynebacterioides]|uniref:UDP-N-acetylmuramyl-tripeptide synthetase n=1 Tax=Rhodococcoides corynebacterioides TaxID=53972 RepID=A0ABS7PAB3_9NOCA|nr:UDP-N-acetylmuramoyl-L-alanyl-D-glutamate--2,6-diaminopimelate ligase [Rhodococcus corynebacterioides]MBY6368529.1 UDP-N-acetylmuramoyl-L-alanyl-D-glutamate--2,6-diaminopimelate ligase [Rhodococcus corynebacterioides]MBY6409374.1 UDP-N-acetylmuramoyl-L-alanyl-D-glutamate--2,6-diaminopimelate ligase [Rhodococcus corynebacterioides]
MRSGHLPRTSGTVTVADVAAFLGRDAPAGNDVAIRDVCDDSRALRPGDLYLALPGRRHHGLEFERDAIERGAVAVVSDRVADHLPTVVVPHPRTVAGPLASWFHGHPSSALEVYGVTGTNGKTSTTHFLHAGLQGAGRSPGLVSGVAISSFDGAAERPIRTTPEATVLQRTLATFVHNGCDSAAVEVSSHAVVEHRSDGLDFAVLAFTNLGRDHLDYHGSMENYYAAKASLFDPERARAAVVGVDDEWGRRLAAECALDVTTVSTSDAAADVLATDIDCTAHRTSFRARTPVGSVELTLPVLGPHQVSNALVALAALVAGGHDLDAAAHGISSVHGIPGRLEPVVAGQPFTALVDYMHNPSGQRSTIPYLRSITRGRLVLVIGATGGRDPGKRAELGAVAGRWADTVIVTDESPVDDVPDVLRGDVLAGARTTPAQVIEIPDRRAAIDRAVRGLGADDTVVVAGRGSDRWQHVGSRRVYFDDAAELYDAIVHDGGAPEVRSGRP